MTTLFRRPVARPVALERWAGTGDRSLRRWFCRVPAFLVCLILASCCVCPNRDAYVAYEAAFDSTSVEHVRTAEGLVRDLGEDWGLRVVVNPPMSKPNDDWSRMSVVGYYNDEAFEKGYPSFWISNSPESLRAAFYDLGGMPLMDLERFVEEVRELLEGRLNLELCRVNLLKGICDEQTPPHLQYRAQFAPSLFEGVGDLMKEVAYDRWALRPHNLARYMPRITAREDAFEVMLFFDNHMYRYGREVLKIGNLDDVDVVLLELFTNGGLSEEDLERLATEVRKDIRERFGVEFCRSDPATGECDVQGGPIGEAGARRGRGP